MIPVSVRALADLLDAEVADAAGAALDTAVTGLVIDSRQATAGSLFLALSGEHVDGHDYVAAAVDNGAAADDEGRRHKASLRSAPAPGLVQPEQPRSPP